MVISVTIGQIVAALRIRAANAVNVRSLQLNWHASSVGGPATCDVVVIGGDILAVARVAGEVEDVDALSGCVVISADILRSIAYDHGAAEPAASAQFRLSNRMPCIASIGRMNFAFSGDQVEEVDYKKRIRDLITPWRAESGSQHCWLEPARAAASMAWVKAFDTTIEVAAPLRAPHTQIHG